MLILSLILCVFALLLVNGTFFWLKSPALGIVLSGLLCMVLFCAGMTISYPFFFQLISLLVIAQAGRRAERSCRWYFATSITCTVAAFGIALWISMYSLNEYAQLRKVFPYESMAERVPLPKPTFRLAPVSFDIDRHLTDLELALETFSLEHAHSRRQRALEYLHERTVMLFVNSPGFGMSRFPFVRPTEETLRLPEEAVPRQPGYLLVNGWSPGDKNDRLSNREKATFQQFHDDGVIDYVRPEAWGFVKDREHVAGFGSHQFRHMPATLNTWQVRTLALISLLLHDQPAVYVSDNLPQMDKIRDVPTRQLDTFEAFGLEALRGGEEIFVGSVPNGLRMLGAVRSVKQCVGCHGGERGDLLGAFSYTLDR